MHLDSVVEAPVFSGELVFELCDPMFALDVPPKEQPTFIPPSVQHKAPPFPLELGM